MAYRKQIGVGKSGFPTIKASVDLPQTDAEWAKRGYHSRAERDELAWRGLVIDMQTAARDALSKTAKDEDAAVVKVLTEYVAGKKGPKVVWVADLKYSDEQVAALNESGVFVTGRN
jgi:hypothetical protein